MEVWKLPLMLKEDDDRNNHKPIPSNSCVKTLYDKWTKQICLPKKLFFVHLSVDLACEQTRYHNFNSAGSDRRTVN